MIVYKHIRLDTNEIFYIGIGNSEKRAYSKKDRNKHWEHIVNKYGYSVEIITTCNTWNEACDIERYLIKYYGRRDLGTGILCNLTDGGEGTLGCDPWNKGKKYPQITGEKNGMYGKTHSYEARLKISNGLKGKSPSEETRERMSISAKKTGRRPPVSNKSVIDVSTNVKYESALEVSKKFNINIYTLRAKLRGDRKNNTNFKYLNDD